MKKPIVSFFGLVVVSALIFGVLYALISFEILDRYITRVMTLAGINIVIALGLNLISGYTGQLALGHAGFMAIGAYTTAVLQLTFGWALLPAIFAGGLVSAFAGLLIGIPTLRLRGDYLAIATLGFGEIIRVVFVNLPELTGGAAGLKNVPRFANGPISDQLGFVWVFCFLFFVVVVMSNLIKSSHGRVFLAIREDEVAAGAMGVNVFYNKVFAFTLSAFIAGIGGGLYAPYSGYLNVTSFTFIKSIDFLIIVVLGGMGSIAGTVITGIIFTFLQEFLRFLQDYRLLVFAAILILIMLFRPQGLMGKKEFTFATLIEKTFANRKKEGDRG